MGIIYNPKIVTDGLVLALDAGNTKSYSGSGTTWKDLSGNGYDFTLSNSGSFNTDSDGIKNMNFLSSYCSRNTDVPPYDYATLMCFTKIRTSSNDWSTLIRGSSSNHPVILSTIGNIGFYSNVAGGFYSGLDNTGSTAYDVDASLPNYDSKYNCLTWKLSNSSPYWQLQYNDSDVVATITNSNVSYATHGIGYICYPGQGWGNIAVFLYYSKHLSQSEILQNYHAFRGRFGV